MEPRQAVMANDSTGFLLMLISQAVDLFLSGQSRVWPLSRLLSLGVLRVYSVCVWTSRLLSSPFCGVQVMSTDAF